MIMPGSMANGSRFRDVRRGILECAKAARFLATAAIAIAAAATAPFYDLYEIQTSFKQREGPGGGRTLGGIPRDRYVGKGIFLWNAELRWRAVDFDMIGRSFHMVFSTFVDTGRVWADGFVPGELFSDLHMAYGIGIKGGMGENFVASMDVGRSSESSASIYMNIGYIF